MDERIRIEIFIPKKSLWEVLLFPSFVVYYNHIIIIIFKSYHMRGLLHTDAFPFAM